MLDRGQHNREMQNAAIEMEKRHQLIEEAATERERKVQALCGT